MLQATSKEVSEVAQAQSGALPQLPGINSEDGIKSSGSEKLGYKLLGDFYKLIDAKANKIEK